MKNNFKIVEKLQKTRKENNTKKIKTTKRIEFKNQQKKKSYSYEKKSVCKK